MKKIVTGTLKALEELGYNIDEVHRYTGIPKHKLKTKQVYEFQAEQLFGFFGLAVHFKNRYSKERKHESNGNSR